MDLGPAMSWPLAMDSGLVENEAQLGRAVGALKDKGGGAANACLALLRLRDDFASR